MNKNDINFCLPNLKQSWLLVALIFAGAMAGSVLLVVLRLLPTPQWVDSVIESQSIEYLMQMLLPFVAIPFISRAVKGNPLAEEPYISGVPINKPEFGELGPVLYTLTALLLIIGAGVVIEPLGSIIPMSDSIKELFEKVFGGSNLTDLILATAILAPVCEEVLCRGIMQRGMCAAMPPWKAILWASFIFAFIHLNPWQAIPAFILGLALGWVYFQSKCIWIPILMHAANNTISIILIKLHPETLTEESMLTLLPPDLRIPVYLAAVALTIGTALLLWHKGAKRQLS